MSIVPPARPQADRAAVLQWMAAAGVADTPIIVGRRGYYAESMAHGDVAARGLYDDALFVVGPSDFAAFNANTDPSAHGGSLADLVPGLYQYQLGIHHPGTPRAYPCLVQAGPVTVQRDNGVRESGEFYIHIHRGGYLTTSSAGCQTIFPDQWPEFYALAARLIHESGRPTIPYLLTARATA